MDGALCKNSKLNSRIQENNCVLQMEIQWIIQAIQR